MAWRGLEGTHLHWDGFLSCDSFKTERGTINAVPSLSKDIVNKEYVDDKNVESFPTAFTSGSVVFSDGTNLTEDNFNLFWDSATHELQPHHMKIVSDGSQASPALKFNDTNTGFFKSGDSVRLSINNSTKMTVDDVEGAEFTGAITINNIVPIFYLEDSNGTSTHSVTSLQVNNSNFNIQTRDSDKVFIAQNYKIIQGASGATDHKWFINNVEAMVIDSSKRVGIGTDSPETELDVHGVTNTRIQVNATATAGINFPGYNIRNEGAFKGGMFYSESRDTIELWDNTAQRIEIDTNGNVDITSGDLTIRAGDLLFTGEGTGLCFAEIYARDNTATTSTSTTKAQILIFDTNGQSNAMTPDHTQDHLTVVKAGKYKIDASISIKNSSGAAHVISIEMYKNNGATVFNNIHAGRTLGTGSDVGNLTMSGIVDLAVDDTIEFWITSDSGAARTVTVEDIDFCAIQIGGT